MKRAHLIMSGELVDLEAMAFRDEHRVLVVAANGTPDVKFLLYLSDAKSTSQYISSHRSCASSPMYPFKGKDSAVV